MKRPNHNWKAKSKKAKKQNTKTKSKPKNRFRGYVGVPIYGKPQTGKGNMIERIAKISPEMGKQFPKDMEEYYNNLEGGTKEAFEEMIIMIEEEVRWKN